MFPFHRPQDLRWYTHVVLSFLLCLGALSFAACKGDTSPSEESSEDLKEEKEEEKGEGSPFDFEGEPPSDHEEHIEPDGTEGDTFKTRSTTGPSAETKGTDGFVPRTTPPDVNNTKGRRPIPTPSPTPTNTERVAKPISHTPAKTVPKPKPAGHDGCRTRGQNCTCSNTGWRGTCNFGPHKSGLYCRCN